MYCLGKQCCFSLGRIKLLTWGFLLQHCYLGAFFRRYKRTMRLIKLAAISMQKEIHWLSLIFCRWNDKETNQWMRSNPLLIQMNHILNSVLDPLVLDITYINHTLYQQTMRIKWYVRMEMKKHNAIDSQLNSPRVRGNLLFDYKRTFIRICYKTY